MEKKEFLAEQEPIEGNTMADNRAVSAFHGQWNLIK
jgi:hypothetical protein